MLIRHDYAIDAADVFTTSPSPPLICDDITLIFITPLRFRFFIIFLLRLIFHYRH